MAQNRRDMNPEYMWNLGDIFADKAAWEDAMQKAEEQIAKVVAVQGTLGKSAEDLKCGLDAIYAAAQQANLVYLYAFLNLMGDNGDAEAQDMEARATRMMVNFSTETAFVNPEILSIDPGNLDAWMQKPELSGYRHMIDDIARARVHTLSEREERLLAMLGDAAGTPEKAFSMFDSVDVQFPDVAEGKPLTHALFGNYREDRSAAVRKDAFEKYFGEYKKHINTISALYAGSVKFDSYFAKARNHAGALESALFANNVPRRLYENLIECIHEAIPTLDRYLKLQKKLLGVETLTLYDLYVPLVSDVDEEMPYEKAKELVKEALKPMGEEYQRLLDRAFNERWIDVYENAGKHPGAFSCGVYGVHPYVLLNHANRLDNAFTLAHELGHCMHSWYSSQTQDFANHDYSIFVAEVASTVNEVLLTRYLLAKEQNPRKRAYILNHLLEGFRTTVFRQTLFAEFEMKAHALYEQGQPLTAQTLCGIYHDLNTTYYPAAQGSEYTDTEWARIPHFYTAFYVYQYATGFCSAVAIADRILNHDGAKDYLKFLTTGGSMYPIDELKIAGVDLTDPQPIRSAMQVFADTVDEFTKLMSEE